MAALNLESRKKLQKIIPMLSSDQSGVVINAASAIDRTLKASGSDFIELASVLTKPSKNEDFNLSADAITLRRQLITAATLLNEKEIENAKLKLDLRTLQTALSKERTKTNKTTSNTPSRFFYFMWFLIGYWVGMH
jgi:hypothetical protein